LLRPDPQSAFARELGFSSEFISLLEADKRAPSLATLNKIAAYLKKDLRLISWNMAHSKKAWTFLLADMSPDIALLQEALKPPQQPFWSSPPLSDDWCICENPK